MKRFRYGADPLAVLAVLAYAANRFLLKPHVGAGFMHDHFNDLLLIPAALPWVLWAQRLLGWRDHDRGPTTGEIVQHLVIWSVICEGIGPLWVAHATADWKDVVAYVVGAVFAGLWWRTAPLRKSATAPIKVDQADRA